MRVLEIFEYHLQVQLDGYGKNVSALQYGSFNSPFGKKSEPFTIAHHTLNSKRWTFLNDVSSENVGFDALGGNSGALEIRFEQGGAGN